MSDSKKRLEFEIDEQGIPRLGFSYATGSFDETKAIAQYRFAVQSQERERIIALLDSEHSEFTSQHQDDKDTFIDDCAACFAIELIKGEN